MRRSRRALRFLLPILRRRRGLAILSAPFVVRSIRCFGSVEYREMRKESTRPIWVREWERRQRGPWPDGPDARSACPVRGHEWTLIELLVCFGIACLLIGLVIKGVAKFRRAAMEADRINHVMSEQQQSGR